MGQGKLKYYTKVRGGRVIYGKEGFSGLSYGILYDLKNC